MHSFTPDQLLDIRTIYHEPDIEAYPRAGEILARFPHAERVVVPSHWNIDALNGDPTNTEAWLQVKRESLVLGVKKSLTLTPNSLSSDFVAPSHANGCAMGCCYCYTARRKGFANPITTYVNIEQIARAIERHAGKRGAKPAPNSADPHLWVYEIGTNSDCSVDAAVSDNLRDLVALFRRLPNAKGAFATKYVNPDLLTYDPQGKTRIRFSVMPPHLARLLDVRTSPVSERITAINEFVRAGWEAHINFAPIVYEDDWESRYRELFTMVDDLLTPTAKAQLQAEVIFLTHNAGLHAVNQVWHPKGEAVLWQPDLQEGKVSHTGGDNLRYKLSLKRGWVAQFRALLAAHLPYCTIRYAF